MYYTEKKKTYGRRKNSDSDSSGDDQNIDKKYKKQGVFTPLDPKSIKKRYIPPDRRPQCGTIILISKQMDEEESKTYPTGRSSPPLITKRCKNPPEGALTPIRKLWDPDFDRPEKLAIFIRGPPHCGKSYLSRQIEQREFLYNPTTTIATINGLNLSDVFSRSRFYDHMKDILDDGVTFIIVEVKFTELEEGLVKMALKRNYKVYGIDLYVDTDSNEFNNLVYRTYKPQIKTSLIYNYIEHMQKNPMRSEVTMLDPIDLYDPAYKVTLFLNNFIEKNEFKDDKVCEDDFGIYKELMRSFVKNPEILRRFPNGLENSVNFDEEICDILVEFFEKTIKEHETPILDKYLNNFKDFQHQKVINYKHKHIRSLEEEFSEFRLLKVYDYQHRRNSHLIPDIENVDLDEIIEKHKEESRKKRLEFYIQLGVGSNELESNPDYPNNWEKIAVERKERKGKRKKKRTKKILRILASLEPSEVKIVRKRVKKMKINEEIQMEVDENPLKNFHIQRLLAVTTLTNVLDENKTEFMEYIKNFLEKLDKIPEISTILQLVILSDFLTINFNFEGSFHYFEPKSGKIEVGVYEKTEEEIIAVLAHELTHCALNLVYFNECKPFKKDDEDRKDEIERLLFEIECLGEENHEVINKILRNYPESEWCVEIMGSVSEIIVLNEKESLIEYYKKIWEFYCESLVDFEKFLRKFEGCSRMSCFTPK